MGTNLETAFNLTDLDALFKIKYGKYHDNVFNTATPAWNEIKKTSDFVGKKLELPVPLGYKGGVGSGTLPETNNAEYGDLIMFRKKMYATDQVDRETIMAASSDIGAFTRAMAECIKKTVEADVWNHTRVLFGNGDGSLGTVDSVTDNGSGNYDVVINSATWKEANFEENMFVNFGSGTDLFDVQSVTPSTRTVVVQRQAGGTNIPTAADVCYMQGSKDNDPHGLKQVTDATSSTLYNITVGRKWQSYQEDVSSLGLTTDLMNKVMTRIEKKVGTPPNMIVTSYIQYEKLLNLLEDQKRYQLYSQSPKGYEKMQGVMSFNGIQFMSSRGAIRIFPDKFCEDDRVYFLNTNYITYHRAPNHGWVKEDIGGNGYLRVAGEDKFEARLATYGNLLIIPTFQGRIKGLATT